MEYTSKNGKHSFFEITVRRGGQLGMDEAVKKILNSLSEFESENPDRRVVSWKPEIHSYGDNGIYAAFDNCGLWIDHEPRKEEATPGRRMLNEDLVDVSVSDLDNALGQD